MPEGAKYDVVIGAAEAIAASVEAGNLPAARQWAEVLCAHLADRRVADGGLPGAAISASLTAANRLQYIGESELARRILHEFSAAARDAGNAFMADLCALRQGHMAAEAGQLAEAESILVFLVPELADPVRTGSAPLHAWVGKRSTQYNAMQRAVYEVELYSLLGKLARLRGNFALSQACLETALDRASDPAMVADVAKSVSLDLASTCLEAGRLDASDDVLDAYVKKWPLVLPETGFAASELVYSVRWLETRVKVLQLRGQWGSALAYLGDVIELLRDMPLAKPYLQATLNRALFLILINQVGLAEAELRDVMAAATEHRYDDLTFDSRRLLAVADARLRSNAEREWSVTELRADRTARHGAPESTSRLIPARPRHKGYLADFEDRNLDFIWCIGQSDVQGALEILRDVEIRFGVTDSVLLRARVLVMRGMLAYLEDRIEAAESLLSDGCAALSEMGLAHDRWQAQRYLGWCWIRLGRAEEQIRQLSDDTQALLEAMRASLPVDLQAVFLLNKYSQDDEYLSLQSARLRADPRAIHDIVGKLDARRRLAFVRTADSESEQVFSDNGKQSWIERLRYPMDHATISFVVLPTFTLMVIQHWFNRLAYRIVPVTRVGLREAVQACYSGLTTFGPGRDVGSRKGFRQPGLNPDALASLSRLLRIDETVNALPRRVRRLTIVPDSSLHTVPFAALLTASSPLIERFAIALSFEHHPARRSRRARAAERGGPLLVAVADVPGQDLIPGVRTEAEHLADWLRRAGQSPTILQDTDATKTEVMASLERASFAHIACHGTLMPQSPDDTGLLLYDTPPVKAATMSIANLAMLDLAGMQHITLSSCWSADHFLLPGRWVVGVPQALRHAGARRIMGSLWKVDDRIAVVFMQQFYAYAAQFGPDEALRRTQVDCRDRRLASASDIDTSSPEHWAGYVLYADRRERQPMAM